MIANKLERLWAEQPLPAPQEPGMATAVPPPLPTLVCSLEE